MTRKKPKPLTRGELRIMEALWQRRSGTVGEIAAALPPPPQAYTTVLTMLRILEQKGVVRRKADGRAHVYYPTIERDDAARSAVGEIVHAFFANSKAALAVRLMSEEAPSQDELATIKRLIAQYERPSSLDSGAEAPALGMTNGEAARDAGGHSVEVSGGHTLEGSE